MEIEPPLSQAESCAAPFCCDAPRNTTLVESVLHQAERLLEQCRSRDRLVDFPNLDPARLAMRGFDRAGAVLLQSLNSDVSRAWVIGDVHGDPVGLACALAFIREEGNPGDLIVLLGDLIDDLPESTEALACVAQALHADDGARIVCVRGNHDVALAEGQDGEFVSTVDPSDFCDHLRSAATRPHGMREREFARSFIRFVKDAPAAIFLRDGTLLAHGGIPHVDLHGGMQSREALGNDEAASDFVWARISNVRRRMAVPQSLTRSREIGSDDFRQFRELTDRLFRSPPDGCAPVQRLIRGHDHVEHRFEVLDGHWERRVVTINNMSLRLPREMGPRGMTPPCIAEWRPCQQIRLHSLAIDPDWQRGMATIQGEGGTA
jgi:hypothetical protein